MIVVGIDSSSVSGSCGICKDGEILANGFVKNGLTHSQTLLPLIDEILEKAKISISDVDLFSITKGPGSFTGLRIGMSTVMGLAAVNNTKCIGVSTLEAAAFGVIKSQKYDLNGKIVCSVMDARCKQVYFAMFAEQNGEFTRICDDMAISADEALNMLKSKGLPVILTGDGAAMYFEMFTKSIENLELAQFDEQYVEGYAVAELGEKYVDSAVRFDKLRPEYLRLPQAQRELKLKMSKNAE